ncbi:Crp/Fnr family transcriptional regulator [Stygiobacter electus]|jgi:CRP-like cAMP-binding protein|uniref:Cyclic nucleotide-binding domain-containing protein n=1 Tax=Stygiobacter electus TaxID=3032292 RepID=A0AAE3TCV0_9BACT|nr:cyclic nucleotide-binding domain-containing protein [Stygiobacter electus]MDF1610533.1 cyclic nucleotide-binding domain-containing protein [Stygiobacter electus]
MSSIRNFKSGEVIAAEGDKSKCFYVLVNGKVGIFKNNKKITEFSKSGEIVGEMSLILGKPRTAEIRALSDSSLLQISGELDDIIKMYPDISKKLIKTLAERLAKTTEGK